MSPHAAPPRLAPWPSTKTGFFVDERPFSLRHPPKQHFWWMNCPFPFAIHQNGTFGGRLPPHLGNLPGKGLFFWKVLRFSGGPSMPGAVFLEGPALFRGTFHARSHFPGRSCVFQGDLPCQGPFFRKVLRFSGGPSMPGVVFPEGRGVFRGTFHARGDFPGRLISGLEGARGP